MMKVHELSDCEQQSIADGYCPDCGWRGFVLGPKGGAMLNVECGNLTCRARFNVLVGYPVTQSHRIEREREGGNDWGKPLEIRNVL